jgi:rRNA maturation endonuclease Nob1
MNIKLPPQLVCAWCKKIIKEGDKKNITHGICDSCAKDITSRWNKYLQNKNKEEK